MTPEREKHLWETVKLFGVAAICISPFWLMAGDLSDGDELKKSGVTVGIVAAAGIWKWLKA